MAWMVPWVLAAVVGAAGPAADAASGASLELCLARGFTHELFGQLEQARRRYELGLAAFDDDPNLLLPLIRVEVRARNLPRARRLTDLLVAHAAYRARALLCRAAIHEALGDEASARSDRDEAYDELDVVLTDRTAAQHFFEQARALLASSRRRGVSSEGAAADSAPSLDEMRRQLHEARR